MKKVLFMFFIPLFIGLSSVSADHNQDHVGTGTGNTAPVAMDDNFTVDVNSTTTLNLVGNDTDADGDDLTVTSIGTILNGSGTLTSSGVIFTPNLDFEGVISFEYTVSDGELTDTGSVIVTVTEINTPPVATDDNFTVYVNSTTTLNLVGNDTDVDGDDLTVTSIGTILNGSGTLTSSGVIFTPNLDFEGVISFEYTLSDGKGGTDTGTVNVKVEMKDEDEEEDKPDNKHNVRDLQKEFVSKFEELKEKYKHLMGNREQRNEYLELKKSLREEYLMKLKELTSKKTDNSDKEKDKSENKNDNSNKGKFKHQGQASINSYVNLYSQRYGLKISLLNDEGLNILLGKIDNLITTINAGNYSDTQKTKYNTMLLALRSIVLDNLSNTDDVLNLDALFE